MTTANWLWPALAVATILMPGCSGPVTHDYQDVYVKTWNKSSRDLFLRYESALGAGPNSDQFYPSSLSEGGAVDLSCNVGVNDPWWLRISVLDDKLNVERSYYWSDVGCGTKYLFTYHEDERVTMVLTGRTPSMTRSDLPKP